MNAVIKLSCALLASAVSLSVAGVQTAKADPTNTVVMQGLDKVTARISTFEAPLDTPVGFGALRITVRHCDRTPPEEPPESVAFLEVDEVKRGQEPSAIFTGWMFASSPALSAMEHPVYDVWVLECVNRQATGVESETDSPGAEPTAE